MKAYQLGFAALVFACATGFTDCEWFSDVTVPASDTAPPTVWNAVWAGGEHKELAPGGSTISYRIAPGETVVAMGAGTDPGGTHKVTIYSSWEHTCCRGSICSITQPSSVPVTETQPGGVGATVSNGVWAYVGVDAPRCGSRSTRGEFHFWWSTEVEDFHGNKAHAGGGEIYYTFP